MKTPASESPWLLEMGVIHASQRGLERGAAMPLDLANKPNFLHDDSVASLDALLDPARGPQAPHPFYRADAKDRADIAAFLRSLSAQPRGESRPR